MKPKISVIMSVYNSESFLRECIKSILDQTFKNFEFIIVNDSSSDGSLAILKEFKKRDKRIIIINNEKNIGLTKSLIKAIKISKGKYIARQDADDISVKERFLKQYEFLEKHPEVYLVGTNAYFLYNGYKFKKWTVTGVEENKKKLLNYNYMIHSSIMFRNDRQVCYREKIYTSQDYDLYLNILSKGLNIDNLEMPFVYFRINDTGISSTKRAKQKFFGRKIKEFYNQRIKTGKDNYESFNPDLEFNQEKSVLEKQNYNHGIQFIIDLMIYANKKETIKLLIKYRKQLPLIYIFKKIFLILIPKRFMKAQIEIRKNINNLMP